MAPKELGRAGRIVSSPKQEAVLILDGNAVQVILRTHFRQGPEELAWVVPVPSRPTNIKPAEDSLFTLLEEGTAPRFYSSAVSGESGIGCGCDNMRLQEGGSWAHAVHVEEVGTAGMFDYTVLSSTDANELGRWLRENGYAIPAGADAAFESYVKKGWHWLAMRIRAESRKEGDMAPHPISYTYRADRLVYPMTISRLSADEENEIVLYVAADERYASTNWSNAVAKELEIRPDVNAAGGTNYGFVVRVESMRNSGRLFVTEYAEAIVTVPGLTEPNGAPRTLLGPAVRRDTGTGRLLTRLRAVVPRGAMDRDVFLAPYMEGHWITPAGGPGVGNNIFLRRDPPSAARLAAPAAPLALAGLGFGLRRRQRWGRRLAPAMLIPACLIFAML